MNLSQLILIGTDIPVFLTVISVFLHKRYLRKTLVPFSRFIYLSGIIHLISLILWFYQMNNMFLLHLYVPLGTILVINFYKNFLGDLINSKIFEWTAVLFAIFSVFNTIFVQHFLTFNSYALTVQSVVISILSLSAFKWLMHDEIKTRHKKQLSSLNWINSGFFIYYSANLVIFYFGEIIMHSISIKWSQHTWMLHSFFSAVMYFCFLIGLWKNRPQ